MTVRELTGNAEVTTSASSEQCMSLLVAVDRYPTWYSDVAREVDVLDRDERGHPTKARTKLHVHYGPLAHDFDLTMAVVVDPAGVVKLTRVPHHDRDEERFDVTWRVRGSQLTQIRLELVAGLSVPRFVPLGGVGDSMAEGFVTAAKRELES